MKIDQHKKHKTLTELQEQLMLMERQISYYKNLADEVAGYNILVDSKTILLKRELQQKNDGFSILSSLHKEIGTQVKLDDLLLKTLNLILTTLKMDKGLILWKKSNNEFIARWILGYTKKEIKILKKEIINVEEINQKGQILINKSIKASDSEKKIQKQLLLPFIVGIPLYEKNVLSAWLIAGREKEAQPFYPPLSNSDVFIFHSIGVFLEAAMANIRLYKGIEEANQKLALVNSELEKKVEIRTRDIAIRNEQLKIEKKNSDDLLLNILPADIALELKTHGKCKPRLYENLSILFTDFVNFTQYASKHTPEELVYELDYIFKAFDTIIGKYQLEKIKTIGDAYLCAGGIASTDSQLVEIINAALDIRDFIIDYRNQNKNDRDKPMEMRLGIHIGSAIAGVVGIKKFAFDIWGDSVNTASRMESHGEAGKINVSGAVYERCKDHFDFEYRGLSEVKNKGKIKMYFVERKKS